MARQRIAGRDGDADVKRRITSRIEIETEMVESRPPCSVTMSVSSRKGVDAGQGRSKKRDNKQTDRQAGSRRRRSR